MASAAAFFDASWRRSNRWRLEAASASGGSTAYGLPEIKIIVAYFASQAESAGALLRSAVNGSGNTSLAYGFFNV